jgi:phenylpropionate dioxygenase-like ring-hydroxylating dioxygenase large terminal subunit
MYLNFWYPICTTAELDEKSPQRADLLGVRVVAFRDNEGNACVLSDTCIHRGGALSEGKVVDGCITCPYHGWAYSGDGRCTSIPSMNGKKAPARAKVDSYPVVEKYGVIFAYMGDLPEAERPPEPVVEEFEQEGWRVTGPIVFEIEGYFERSVENGLDPFHNEFVHPAQGAPRVESDQVEIEDQDWGSSFLVGFSGYTEESSRQKVSETTSTGDLKAGSWHIGPNTLVTGIYLAENNSFIQYFFEQPISKRRTKIFFINARNNALDADKDDWINSTFMNIAGEDRHIIENLRPFATPDTLTKELLTPGDAPVVRYREHLKTWEKNGWRIDWQALQNNADDVAYAIPSPARRESGNWVLDTIPTVSTET